jgi:oligopeptide/dipeptide ABC transporter ATP-binding protein
MAALLITHDLSVVADVCERVGVMYAGQLVEFGPVHEVLASPLHPYTRALLRALPRASTNAGELRVIPGEIPDLEHPPSGCRFVSRCAHAFEACAVSPVLSAQSERDSRVACWLHETGPHDPFEPDDVAAIEPSRETSRRGR